MSLIAVSILALAWLAVLGRDQRIIDDASSRLIAGSKLSPAEFGREASRLGEAGLANPDPTWRLNRGGAWLGRDPRRAAEDFEQILRDEPENLAAWKFLFLATRELDRPRAAQAEARIRRLDPLGSF